MNIFSNDFTAEEAEREYTIREVEAMSDEEYMRVLYVKSCQADNEGWNNRVKKVMQELYPDRKMPSEIRNLSAELWNINMMA